MAITTTFGFWANYVELSPDVETYVSEVLDYNSEYDIDAVVREFRKAINDALPDGVVLSGNEFIGPAYEADRDFRGYSTDDDGRLDITAIIDSIDLWSIAQANEK